MTKSTKQNRTKSGTYKKADYLDYVRFIAFPRAIRKDEFGYKSDFEFADEHEVSRGTLYEWKKKDEFWDEVRILWKRWGRDRMPDVLLGLYKKAATTGDAGAAKVYAQLIEEFKETGVIKHTFEQTSLEKIQKGVRAIIDSEKKKSNERKRASKKKVTKKKG